MLDYSIVKLISLSLPAANGRCVFFALARAITLNNYDQEFYQVLTSCDFSEE